MKSFRELDVWNIAMDLVDRVYELINRFPVEERFALCDQLRRAVVSVPSNIAEGFGRETHRDFAHFLVQARGSLYEVETQLEIAVRRGYVNDGDLPLLQLNNLSKMISSLVRTLRSEADLIQGTSLSAQGTRHEAQGASFSAQGTKHKAQGTPSCPKCGKPMRKMICRKGRNAGNAFWSCTGYPECNGTRNF